MKSIHIVFLMLSSLQVFSQGIQWTTEGCKWDSIYTYNSSSIDELINGFAMKGWAIESKTDSTIFISQRVKLDRQAYKNAETALPRIALQPNLLQIRIDWRPTKYRASLLSSLVFNEDGAVSSSILLDATFTAGDYTAFQIPLVEATSPKNVRGSKIKKNKFWLESLGNELSNLLAVEKNEASTW